MCTPTSESQALAGEDCRASSRGLYFITTNAAMPFATGRIMDAMSSAKNHQVYFNPISHIDPFQKEIDTFGKLEGNFNNAHFSPTSGGDFLQFFVNQGSNQIAQSFINTLKYSYDDYESRRIMEDESVGKTRWPDVKSSSRHPRVNGLMKST